MDYLKERTFELFRYTLPGVFLISIAFLIDERIKTPFEIYSFYREELSIQVIIGVIIIGFIIGLVIDQFSGILVKILWRKKLEPDYKSNSKLSGSQKYALVRQKSPENYRNIENHNAQKGMCDNLALGLLTLSIISIYKIFATSEILIWIVLILISLISMFSLLLKARKFNQWARQDINAAVDMIIQTKEK